MIDVIVRSSVNIPLGKKVVASGGFIKAVVKTKTKKGTKKSARGIKKLFKPKNNILLTKPLQKDESSVINESMLNHSQIIGTAEKELAKT